MPKPSYALAKNAAHRRRSMVDGWHATVAAVDGRRWTVVFSLAVVCAVAGCATPQYAVRPTPRLDESPAATSIERTISAVQAKEFEQHGTRLIRPDEVLRGFAVQQIVNRLSRVTERSSLQYRAYLYTDTDPNAAALADGRVYLSSGLLSYLGSRGSRADELAFILGHELAHTVAQHLVKRYRTLQQQQLLMGVLAAGTAAVAGTDTGLQQAGRLALDAASLLSDVAASGYSQAQELEADQLGIRYVIRAGFDPRAALDLLQDFARFDTPWPFLRTHPYITQRRADLQRYLAEQGRLTGSVTRPTERITRADRARQLREVQKLYPVGSVSWNNLQHQIDALEGPH